MIRHSGLYVVFFLALAGLGACSESLTTEQRIIVAIREMEAKIEASERRRFMSHIAEDFQAQGGSMNRDQVRAMVVFQLNRHKNLQAQLFPIAVSETSETTASAKFRALVTGGPGWFPDSGQVFDFETQWRLENGEWLLTAADWDPTPLEEAL